MKNSIRRLLAFSLITSYFALTTCIAQAPQRLSYQAEIRNASNALVVNTLVGMRFSILQGSATGTVVYSERQTPTTNANGLVSLQIGGGTVISGVFANIAWGSGTYFLKTETDPAGGTNYTISGTQQMLSVPYALYANTAATANSATTAGSATTATTAANGVPAGGNEGQVLTRCGGVAIWTTGGVCPGTITALTCVSATNTGTLASGTLASGVSSSVPYTGGNGGPHSGQTVTSTGVTGLTATLAAGSFASGAGSLTYTITGTPAAGGTASFALNIGGKTCTLTRTIVQLAGTITALNCSTVSNAGTLSVGVVASNVSSSISYSGGNGGSYAAQTVASTGVTGLTANLAAGTLASGAGNLNWNISGTPISSGLASFTLNIGGQTCTFTRVVGGIPSIISTSIPTLVTTNSAISGGEIISDAGSVVTSRGVVWSSIPNPTIALSTKTSDFIGTGLFSSQISGLSPGTQYYVRAYATNSFGTAYGPQVSFSTVPGSISDIEGNVYNAVTIGRQVWMKENLRVSYYRNGNGIPIGPTASWGSGLIGACAIFNNDPSNNLSYGKLYNWYAVSDPRGLCPTGWHVPSDEEWKTLEIYLGMSTGNADMTGGRGSAQNVGGKMKAVSGLWVPPNTGADNSSGFSGLPGGNRGGDGTFLNVGYAGLWWSSTQYDSTTAWYRTLNNSVGSSFRYTSVSKYSGMSVRCLRD